MAVVSDEDSVLNELHGRVGVITLNRPKSLNAFTTDMALRLIEAMEKFVDDTKVRVVVITGAESKGFCTGADLKERNTLSSSEWRAQHKVFERKNEAIRNCPKPVIGAINGIAVGGGMELAMQADFLVASELARFGQPEVKRGIMPGGGGTQWLPRRVPLGMALQILMTGEMIDAQTALRIGLVNEVTKPDELLGRAIEIAEVIASNSPAAIEQLRKSVRLGVSQSIEAALEIELECYDRMVDHPDRKEGVAAFVEKRIPSFLDPEH